MAIGILLLIPDKAIPRKTFGTDSSMMIVKLGTSLGKSLASRSFQERASLPAALLKEKITTAGLPLAAAGSSIDLPVRACPEICGSICPRCSGDTSEEAGCNHSAGIRNPVSDKVNARAFIMIDLRFEIN
jgi:hypothetical protein